MSTSTRGNVPVRSVKQSGNDGTEPLRKADRLLACKIGQQPTYR
jgi:hypothetical protein